MKLVWLTGQCTRGFGDSGVKTSDPSKIPTTLMAVLSLASVQCLTTTSALFVKYINKLYYTSLVI